MERGNKLGVEPYSIRVSPEGELFAVDSVNSNIVRITPPLSQCMVSIPSCSCIWFWNWVMVFSAIGFSHLLLLVVIITLCLVLIMSMNCLELGLFLALPSVSSCLYSFFRFHIDVPSTGV